MAYAVHTPVFEGPFDVLLHLITKQQVELYDVSLSTIVDGFLAHLEGMQQEGVLARPGPERPGDGVATSGQEEAEAEGVRLDLESVTQFLLIASTLVELKTRRLLPGREEIDLDEELALWEERDLLLARLVECKTFKDAASALLGMEDQAKQSYPRRAGMEERFLSLTPDLLEGTNPERLRKAFLKALKPKPEQPRVTLDHVTAIRMTVQDAMEELSEVMPRVGQASFRRLTAKYSEPLEVIVCFLALLELYKQGVVELSQTVTFGEMNVEWLVSAGHRPLDRPDPMNEITAERVLADAYEG